MVACRVLVAGFGPIYRTGLCSALPTSDDRHRITVVGVAEDLERAIRLVRLLRPTVVITDLGFGPDPGAAVRQLREAFGGVHFLVLTDIEHTLKAVVGPDLGVSGVLFRPVTKMTLLDALGVITSGGTYFEGVEPPIWVKGGPPPFAEKLSKREHQVLHLLGLGFTNSEIAAQLVLSIRTVETHRSKVQQKLGIRTRAELAAASLRAGPPPSTRPLSHAT